MLIIWLVVGTLYMWQCFHQTTAEGWVVLIIMTSRYLTLEDGQDCDFVLQIVKVEMLTEWAFRRSEYFLELFILFIKISAHQILHV